MYPKPKGFNNVGFIQCFLALFFVLWFLILPQDGKYFAWPVIPETTAMFLGAGFILRSYFGYHLWRDKHWYTLRWSLATLFVTTWWHASEMNWHINGVSDGLRIFSLIITHVWILAYTFEPLTVFLLHPRDPQADAPVPPELQEGEIQPVMKTALASTFFLGAAFWAILFIAPEFANTRWPWELNPFDSRIMAAWFAGSSVWSVTMYFMKDWAEIKVGVRSLMLFLLGEFGVWIVASSRYPLNAIKNASQQNLTYGIALFLVCALYVYAYWKQEQANKKS